MQEKETIREESQWKPNRWPNFKLDEFRCKGDGKVAMDATFLDRLQRLRDLYGKPLRIMSGYRSPEYNNKVSFTGLNGPHTTGRAVDILIDRAEAYKLLVVALDCGFTGVGVAQKGPTSSRFLHLDDLEAPDHPRPNIWSY